MLTVISNSVRFVKKAVRGVESQRHENQGTEREGRGEGVSPFYFSFQTSAF